MRYTPAQLREALDISEDTLRYWRELLPQLNGRRGYAPCFTPGDLLTLKVVAALRDLGMNIGMLKTHSKSFFDACSQRPWFELELHSLVFDGEFITMGRMDAGLDLPIKARVVVPLGPLIQQLRQRLAAEEVQTLQPEITFPPLGIAKGASR